MTNYTENSIESLKSIQLTSEEKAAMKSRLLSYADVHTVQKEILSFYQLSPIYSFRLFATAALVLVLLVGTTGVSFAAENTLPGQPLYAFKVDVAEPVQGALITSPVAKATWQNTLAERRLNEASELAAKNELSSSTAAYIDQQVALHVAASNADSVALAQKGDTTDAVSVQSDLAARLSAHIALLSIISPRLAEAGDASTSARVAILLQKIAAEENKTDLDTLIASATSTGTSTPTPSSAIAGTTTLALAAPATHAAYARGIQNAIRREEVTIFRQDSSVLLALPASPTATSTASTTVHIRSGVSASTTASTSSSTAASVGAGQSASSHSVLPINPPSIVRLQQK